jgi:hypothetical protein
MNGFSEGEFMNTVNHLYIARVVYKYFRRKYNFKLYRSSFMLGNIAPDFYPNVVLKPHYIGNYEKLIQAEIIALKGRAAVSRYKAEYYLRLGRVCHYISDFFCLAHNAAFSGNSRSHFKYEHKLSKYCKINLDRLYSIDFMPVPPVKTSHTAFFYELSELHKYFMGLNPKMSYDLFYSIYACIQVVDYIIVETV